MKCGAIRRHQGSKDRLTPTSFIIQKQQAVLCFDRVQPVLYIRVCQVKRKGRQFIMKFRTVNYTISSERLPMEFDAFKIVHLSDLHGALYGKNNEELVQEIRRISPHSILMTGDMADGSPHGIPRLKNLCSQLCGDFPVYCVLGNHEQELGQNVRIPLLKSLKKMGVTILENEWRILSRQGASIRLYGLVTPMKYYKDILKEYQWGVKFSAEDAGKLLGSANDSCYKILLAHNPLYYPAYRDWGADLTLSGHIHGGIIRIPKLGGLLSPDLTLFPKYDGGHFKEQGKDLVVSRGLGNHFLVRVMNPPELVSITLHSQKLH